MLVVEVFVYSCPLPVRFELGVWRMLGVVCAFGVGSGGDVVIIVGALLLSVFCRCR